MSEYIFLHGLSGYANHGCRCEICTAACRANGQRRRQMIKAGLKTIPSDIHGTENGYGNWICRCAACTEAHRIHRTQTRARAKRRAARLAASR